MARTILNEHSLPKYFWAEAVNTACYILNRVLVRPPYSPKLSMSYGTTKNPMFHILKSLGVSVLS